MNKLKDLENFDEIIDSQQAEDPRPMKPRARKFYDRKLKAYENRKKREKS